MDTRAFLLHSWQADKEREEVDTEPTTELALAGGIPEGRAKAQGIGVHLAKMRRNPSNQRSEALTIAMGKMCPFAKSVGFS